MNRLFTLLIVLFCTLSLQAHSLSGYSIDSITIAQLTKNLNEVTLQSSVEGEQMKRAFIEISNEGRFNDLMIIELYTSIILPDDEGQKLLDSFTQEGFWSDVNYADNRRSPWDPSLHLMRTYALTKLYFCGESKFYGDEQLLSTIMCAIDYWHSKREEYICPNWWYNKIFVPRYLGQIYLLLQDELSCEQLTTAKEIMSISLLDMTGQNRVWLAGNVLMRGLLEEDIELVERARDAIVEEIFLSLDEGLQYDNSFHQHGEQMQFGNYGLAYLSSQVYWARVLRDTRLSVPLYKQRMLRDYTLGGIQWIVWRGAVDPSASARQLFKDSQRGKSYAMSVAINNMRGVDGGNSELYDSFLQRNLYDTAVDNDLVGTNYFYHSDYFVKRAKDWFASVRMNSDRIIGFEMTNNENLQGAHSADGVMILWIEGDEYSNIYPLWDWKRLPGLTYFEDGEPIPFTDPRRAVNRSDFVGGATSGDNGVAVMHYCDSLIEVRKSYFFLDNLVVSLGADINVEGDYPTVTTLDQRLVRDGAKVIMGGVDGKVKRLGKKGVQSELSWLHYDKVGYVLPHGANIELSQQSREESWQTIATSFPATSIAKGDIFTASILHPDGVKGGEYSYVILPNRDAEQVKAFAAEPTVKILQNSKRVQAVTSTDGDILSAVFYQGATLEVASGYSITTSEGVALLLEREAEGYRLILSDPTQKLESVKVTLRQAGKELEVEVALPLEDGYRGDCVGLRVEF